MRACRDQEGSSEMKIQLILASRYLMGRKLRTFLTTLAVVFAALVIFGMNTLLPTMLEAFQANILAASGQVDVRRSLDGALRSFHYGDSDNSVAEGGPS